MATPWKHPKTGGYYFRQATPSDLLRERDRLRDLGFSVGGEAKRSLKTHDPAEARRQWSKASDEQQEAWARMRGALANPPRRLSHKEIVTLSADACRALNAAYTDDPVDDETRRWAQDLRQAFATLNGQPVTDAMRPLSDYEVRKWIRVVIELYAPPSPDNSAPLHLDLGPGARANLRSITDAMLIGRVGGSVEEESKERFLSQFLADLPRSNRDIENMAQGDYREPNWLKGRPTLDALTKSKPVTMEALIQKWIETRNPKPASIKRYRERVAGVMDIAGRDDVARLTQADVKRWRDAMEAQTNPKLTGASIRDRLGALRGLLKVGISRDLLKGPNAADDVSCERKDSQAPRRDFTEEEQASILVAARKERNPFLRWGPFLLAYTGMRIGEIAQLRRDDLRKTKEAGWVVRVTADAGSAKTAAGERDIPLHKAVIREGFVEFVDGVKGGRLFPKLWAGNVTYEKASGRASHDLSRWLRGPKVAIKDKSVGPAHSWRHTHHTASREAGTPLETRKGLVGHTVVADGGPRYGVVKLATKRRAIDAIPEIPLGPRKAKKPSRTGPA